MPRKRASRCLVPNPQQAGKSYLLSNQNQVRTKRRTFAHIAPTSRGNLLPVKGCIVPVSAHVKHYRFGVFIPVSFPPAVEQPYNQSQLVKGYPLA